VSPVVKIFLKLINGNNMFVLKIKQTKQKDTCAKKMSKMQRSAHVFSVSVHLPMPHPTPQPTAW